MVKSGKHQRGPSPTEHDDSRPPKALKRNPPQDEKDHHELYKTGHETKLVVAVTTFSKTGREAEEQELCSEEAGLEQAEAWRIPPLY
jgi:hypothetical protein